MSKADLRSAALSSNNQRMEVVEIEIGGGKMKMGVLQPSMDLRTAFGDLIGEKVTPAKARAVKIESVMRCACDPDTKELLFDEADRAELRRQPAGGWIDKISDVVGNMMKSPEEEIAEAKKD
jgi:hypothetical protein